MPSPFPGMDPFIEAQRWASFHSKLINVIGDLLNPGLPPDYVSEVETRVTIYEPGGDGVEIDGLDENGGLPGIATTRVADVAVIDEGWRSEGGGDLAVVDPPRLETEFRLHEDQRTHYLTVRDADSREVVTVIEVLSPKNKRSSAAVPSTYEEKRLGLLHSDANLVEIDLLRRGRRADTVDPLPQTAYAVFVSRTWRRPKVEVTPVGLLQPLPAVLVPLREGEEPVSLDLQEAVSTAYDRGYYHRLLRYDRPIDPPLPPEAAALVVERLQPR